MILSAGAIVVRKQKEAWWYLLLRSYRNWDFPKGLVNARESPFDAAVREVREETGICDLNFHWGKIYCESLPYGKKIARYYIAETHRTEVVLPVSPELGRPEHHESRWVSREALGRLAPTRLSPVLAWLDIILDHKKTCLGATSS